MTNEYAVLLAFCVPFLIEAIVVYISRRQQFTFPVGTTYFFMFLIACTGVPFIVASFRPLYAALIAIVYLPVMTQVLVAIPLIVAGGLWTCW